MAYSAKKDRRNRKLVFLLALVGVCLYAYAFFQPVWGFHLFAPQYPYGLNLSIYLNRVDGDVTEINILNHYIGMGKLDEAAKVERALSVYLVGGLSLVILSFVILPARRYARLLAIPAYAFPVLFFTQMYYWMYRFGHELSPAAPVKVPGFTPKVIGDGVIGNFSTTGLPGAGFYLILAGSVLIGIAFSIRHRICESCPNKHGCNHVCPTYFLKPPKNMPSEKEKS